MVKLQATTLPNSKPQTKCAFHASASGAEGIRYAVVLYRSGRASLKLGLKIGPTRIRAVRYCEVCTGGFHSGFGFFSRTVVERGIFQVLMNLIMSYLVFFIISMGSCRHAFKYEVSAYSDKYVTKNYFEKYGSLTDPEFVEFIGSKIPQDLCKEFKDEKCVMPTVLNLRRDLLGGGSHRVLSSSIRLKLQPELKSLLSSHSCKVVIIERLPLGIFADPFELQHLLQRGAFTDAVVLGDTNLELPAFLSNRSAVEVHVRIASQFLSRDDLELNFDIPLHSRYPALGNGFSRVVFRQPDLSICCNLENFSLERRCLSIHSHHISDDKSSPVVWEIPCGIKQHAGAVFAGTFGFAIASALLIVVTSICYSICESSYKLKES